MELKSFDHHKTEMRVYVVICLIRNFTRMSKKKNCILKAKIALLHIRRSPRYNLKEKCSCCHEEKEILLHEIQF